MIKLLKRFNKKDFDIEEFDIWQEKTIETLLKNNQTLLQEYENLIKATKRREKKI